MPVVKYCSKLKADEDAAKRKQDAIFPTSVDDFRKIRTREIQLRIARFLTSDDRSRERMMSEFGWAYRQISPLLQEYRADVSPEIVLGSSLLIGPALYRLNSTARSAIYYMNSGLTTRGGNHPITPLPSRKDYGRLFLSE